MWLSSYTYAHTHTNTHTRARAHTHTYTDIWSFLSRMMKMADYHEYLNLLLILIQKTTNPDAYIHTSASTYCAHDHPEFLNACDDDGNTLLHAVVFAVAIVVFAVTHIHTTAAIAVFAVVLIHETTTNTDTRYCFLDRRASGVLGRV
jgi:hypothetical protein